MNDTKAIIKSIQNLGYKILIEGDKIKLSYLGNGKPLEEARPIIKEIRENRDRVMEYLSNIKEMEVIFKTKVYEIAQVYHEDTMSFIMIVFPRMYDKAINLETRINMVWDEGKDPKTFKEAVNLWGEIYKNCIKLFCDKNGIDTIWDGVYNSPNGKPGPSQGLGKEANDNGTV